MTSGRAPRRAARANGSPGVAQRWPRPRAGSRTWRGQARRRGRSSSRAPILEASFDVGRPAGTVELGVTCSPGRDRVAPAVHAGSVQRPGASGMTWPSQPVGRATVAHAGAAAACARRRRSAPTVAATASWPSRKTVAETVTALADDRLDRASCPSRDDRVEDRRPRHRPTLAGQRLGGNHGRDGHRSRCDRPRAHSSGALVRSGALGVVDVLGCSGRRTTAWRHHAEP